MLRQKPTQVLKETTIHFYYLLDESCFSDICTIIESKELNWLCKHKKRQKQPTLYFNEFCAESSFSMWVPLSLDPLFDNNREENAPNYERVPAFLSNL